jgi:hypothetical protein
MKALSIAKIDEGSINEDAAKATERGIAVSDGAGGGGVFADRWSKYLVEHLPDEPITDHGSFDKWIDGIWEAFYNECEAVAKEEGGMFLNKFYDEGSFATIVAVWNNGQWISYGDSVAFCYDKDTGTLQHTFGRITDFNNPPYLVNCKDPTDEKGFKCGRFEIHGNSVVFAASDSLAHYILMMYELAHKDCYADELQEAINAQTKDSNFVKTGMSLRKIDFEKKVLQKLLHCRNNGNFLQHLRSLRTKGLIGHDDYSLVIM